MTGQADTRGIHPPLSCSLTAAQTLLLGGFHGQTAGVSPTFPRLWCWCRPHQGDESEQNTLSGLMTDFQLDPSSFHQKWDLLYLRSARQRPLYTEIKNFSSAVTATNQDEPKALYSDDISAKLQSSLKIPNPNDPVFRDESNFMCQTNFLHILECKSTKLLKHYGCRSLSRWFACFLHLLNLFLQLFRLNVKQTNFNMRVCESRESKRCLIAAVL